MEIYIFTRILQHNDKFWFDYIYYIHAHTCYTFYTSHTSTHSSHVHTQTHAHTSTCSSSSSHDTYIWFKHTHTLQSFNIRGPFANMFSWANKFSSAYTHTYKKKCNRERQGESERKNIQNSPLNVLLHNSWSGLAGWCKGRWNKHWQTLLMFSPLLMAGTCHLNMCTPQIFATQIMAKKILKNFIIEKDSEISNVNSCYWLGNIKSERFVQNFSPLTIWSKKLLALILETLFRIEEYAFYILRT